MATVKKGFTGSRLPHGFLSEVIKEHAVAVKTEPEKIKKVVTQEDIEKLFES